MKKFERGQSLTWAQPSVLKMEYELRAGEDIVANLRFKSLLGGPAKAETEQGCWTFKPSGMLLADATIRPCTSDTVIATFKNNTVSVGGTIELADGRTLLAATNFGQTLLSFKEKSGADLVYLRNGTLGISATTVEILSDVVFGEGLSWLVPFAWYLALILRIPTPGTGGGGAGS